MIRRDQRSRLPARPDNTYASIADLRGGHTPTITIVPGTDTTAAQAPPLINGRGIP